MRRTCSTANLPKNIYMETRGYRVVALRHGTWFRSGFFKTVAEAEWWKIHFVHDTAPVVCSSCGRERPRVRKVAS